ncbi:hypothetical protein HTZ84_11395 [Haloterrigena sp. SYSU A558-1]|uniref:Cox cluster protein n=1 Tax=Haloterrigena gelatinilytica TaxID=2741724 RepID=A0A8J8GJX1_9EURY|nr:DUF6684 family protein [Haloterrigena gelatinilytica]NUB91354.1 hypothetical protein [Haloterrigena gelatinilytica]NUC72907.1 hypothetical protein [Haloterrigena gelatinilytica]
MSRRAFDAEITLDLAVNLIPLAIMVFFVALFAVFNPWGIEPLQSTIQFAILLSMIATLGFVTYYAARVIERDDRTYHDTTTIDQEKD